LSAAQEDALKVFVSATLPRSTRQVGAWIEQEFGLVYESRSGLIALLHRLGLDLGERPDKLEALGCSEVLQELDRLRRSAENEKIAI
jgi:transposase